MFLSGEDGLDILPGETTMIAVIVKIRLRCQLDEEEDGMFWE